MNNKILDCTLRDGGYINNWNFDDTFINEYLSLMSKLNIDFVEIGFINNYQTYKNELVGNVRHLNKKFIKELSEIYTNLKFVVMGDFGNINYELLNENIPVDMVRIAFHKKNFKEALEECNNIKKLGYKVSANPMAITNYNEDELNELIKLSNDYKIDYWYIVDSYGSLNQLDVKLFYDNCKSKLKYSTLGIHLHNNMNNAFSNYEYLVNNFNNDTIIVDSTLYGMGRGAGNLQTELVLLSKQKNIDKNGLSNMLKFIYNRLKPYYKNSYNEWGYDIDFFISGLLKIHPNYVVKMRDNNYHILKIIDILFYLNEHYEKESKSLDLELISKF